MPRVKSIHDAGVKAIALFILPFDPVVYPFLKIFREGCTNWLGCWPVAAGNGTNGKDPP